MKMDFSYLLERLTCFLWGMPTLILFFLIGFYFSFRTRFFQITRIRYWMSRTIGTVFHSGSQSEEAECETEGESVSPFEAVSAALAGSMGIGNIVGVATALTAGGPGAIFWMWISAIFGSMTKYAEIVLGFMYRYREEDGAWMGGPMVTLQKGLHAPILSVCFCVSCIMGSFVVGNMTQGNSMAELLNYTYHIPTAVTGTILSIVIAGVIVGGMERIGKLSSVLIPFLSISYMVCCIIIILVNIRQLPGAIHSIFCYAFRLRPAVSGVVGYTLQQALRIGVVRGVFSNEAGMGSSVIAHTMSSARSGVEQGMWGIFEVMADTLIVCTLTALAILTSGVYDLKLYQTLRTQGIHRLPDGGTLAADTFSSVFGDFGQHFLTIATVLFAFATIVAWSHYGEQCVRYLFGEKYGIWYRFLYVLAVIPGCMIHMQTVWNMADIFNAAMAIPNLFAVCILSEKVIEQTRSFI